MEKIKYLVLLVWIIPGTMKADVIYSPYTDIGISLSLECIGSYELSFTRYNTVDFWGGVGTVAALTELRYPAFGTEMAIEFRQYFKNNLYENFNLGLYAGFAYMRYPYFYHGLAGHDNSVGFVPGLKLTYKKRINTWLIIEPYIGVSAPWYDDSFGELFDWMSHSDPGLMLTLGFRIGFNQVRFKK